MSNNDLDVRMVERSRAAWSGMCRGRSIDEGRGAHTVVHDEYARMSPEERARLYGNYNTLEAYQNGRDPDLLLPRTGTLQRVTISGVRSPPEGRLFAYVLDLSRHWEADWSGLLQFIRDEGEVVDMWNALSLLPFRLVAPSASSRHGHAMSAWR